MMLSKEFIKVFLRKDGKIVAAKIYEPLFRFEISDDIKFEILSASKIVFADRQDCPTRSRCEIRNCLFNTPCSLDYEELKNGGRQTWDTIFKRTIGYTSMDAFLDEIRSRIKEINPNFSLKINAQYKSAKEAYIPYYEWDKSNLGVNHYSIQINGITSNGFIGTISNGATFNLVFNLIDLTTFRNNFYATKEDCMRSHVVKVVDFAD